jgi:nucleoid DNA-binding protein
MPRKKAIMTDLERVTHKDICYAVSDELGVIVSDIDLVLKTAYEYILEQLRAGATVTLHNIGGLGTKIHADRFGRNPKTGERVFVPPVRKIEFLHPRRLKLPLIPEKLTHNEN